MLAFVLAATAGSSSAFAPRALGPARNAPQPPRPLAARSLGASSPQLRTGTSYLPEETVERAKAGNKFEKDKLAKDGTTAFTDVYEYAKAIREGKTEYDKIDGGDVNMVSHRTSSPSGQQPRVARE